MMGRQGREKLIKTGLAVIAFLAVLILAFIVLFLFREGLPIFRFTSPKEFFLGAEWYPTSSPLLTVFGLL